MRKAQLKKTTFHDITVKDNDDKNAHEVKINRLYAEVIQI